ncbi:hypothetical protein B0A49_01575 [Cryomyces minteri]|uniref:GTP-binding protein n=1 Tax=Cryomyces minteri TaxID=331657 RepID=A0A4U0XT85_9PEZI|nr:hypothetical protein B0A49_01575 [Cryomyces minteri]
MASTASQSLAPRRQKQRKVLLMGKSGAGKSSMRSIVFSNYVAKDVRRLGVTIDVEHSNIRFMGSLVLNLWDCGGQDGFTESYLDAQRGHVFSAVSTLIFVFDIESRDFQGDLISYSSIIRALHEHSPTAKIFVLIHKMDLMPANTRHSIFLERSDIIRKYSEREGFSSSVSGRNGERNNGVEFWATSIWDQSLYKAWTQVIYYLVPNASAIETLLRQLAEVIDARELILYERTTCLMVTHVTRGVEAENPYTDRFERISSILKTQKQSMASVLPSPNRSLSHLFPQAPISQANTALRTHSKHTGIPAGSANFAELQIKTGRFMFFITRLTDNTNLAAAIPPSEQVFNTARLNIQLVRWKFDELDIATKKKVEAAPAPATG